VVREAAALFFRGIYVYPIAISTQANIGLLQKVAKAGGTSKVYVVNDAAELKKAIDDIMTDLNACKSQPNNECVAAIPLTAANKFSASDDLSKKGVTNTVSSMCSTTVQGDDLFFSLDVIANTAYRVTVADPAGGTLPFTPRLYMFSDCAKPKDSCYTIGQKSRTFFAARSGKLFIGVDASTTSGKFTITAETITELKLRIVEFNVGDPDYLVIRNDGSATVDLQDYYLSTGNLDTRLPHRKIAPGEKVYIIESSKADPSRAQEVSISGNIPHSGTSEFNAYLCIGPCDTTGTNVVDLLSVGQNPPALRSSVTFTGTLSRLTSELSVLTDSYIRNAVQGKFPTFLSTDWAVGPKTRP
jgi:hypothetical protein